MDPKSAVGGPKPISRTEPSWAIHAGISSIDPHGGIVYIILQKQFTSLPGGDTLRVFTKSKPENVVKAFHKYDLHNVWAFHRMQG